MIKGIAVAVLHCLLVLSLAGKYLWDREHSPRVWVKAAPFDPDMPLRGRYVSLQLVVNAPPSTHTSARADLSVRDGKLVATPNENGRTFILMRPDGQWIISEPFAYFIPEHVPDPSVRPVGEELWVEVTLPSSDSPRPIRLGVKKAHSSGLSDLRMIN